LSGGARAWIDGASRGNPGDAGFGVVFETDGRAEEILGFLGRTTNNAAEYAGLLAALTRAAELGLDRLTVASDSELLVRQMAGTYRVKAPNLVPLFLRAVKLRRAIPHVAIRHVPRRENSRADGLANRAIDERAPLPAWLELPA
jgi:ribonuclease HI